MILHVSRSVALFVSFVGWEGVEPVKETYNMDSPKVCWPMYIVCSVGKKHGKQQQPHVPPQRAHHLRSGHTNILIHHAHSFRPWSYGLLPFGFLFPSAKVDGNLADSSIAPY